MLVELLGQAARVLVGHRAATPRLQHPAQFVEAWGEGFQHLVRALPAQARQQLVQRVVAGAEDHEFVVQAQQAAVAQAHVRVFEGAGAAQRVEADRLGGEVHAGRLEGRRIAAVEMVEDEPGEGAEAQVQRVAHGRAGALREDRRADHGGAEDAQADFQQPPHRLHERGVRVHGGGDTDQRGGVAGEHAGVGTEVAVARRAGGAQADPDRHGEQEQHALLGEQGDQRDHHGQPEDAAEDAVEALGEHLPALRLHDDEHGDGRRARLRQLQAHRQPQGDEGGEQHLEQVDPGHAVAARPFEGRAADVRQRRKQVDAGHLSVRPMRAPIPSPAPSALPSAYRGRSGCRRRGPPPARRGWPGAPRAPVAPPVAAGTGGSAR
ncbi:hypothetical protein D3C76_568440 [compost metagenome]